VSPASQLPGQVVAKVGPPRGPVSPSCTPSPPSSSSAWRTRQPRHAGLWHLLGEIEVVFGFWAMVLMLVMFALSGTKRP
jgi:hypothetical protein